MRRSGATSPPGPDAHERFTQLFDSTHHALLAYAVRRTADPSDAADVVAETFAVAWRRLDAVPEGTEARAWLFGVARRVLANHHRGERRRMALSDRLREAIEEATVPSAGAVSRVEEALATLSEPDQEILRLVAWEQLARDEIALAMGQPRATVRTRLHRARRRLAAAMAALDCPPAGAARDTGPATGPATDPRPDTRATAWPSAATQGASR